MKALKEKFVTTVNYEDYPEYGERAILLSKSDRSLLGEILLIPRLLKATRQAKLFLLDSSSGKIHPDLMGTILIRCLPRSCRPVIVFMGNMWQKDKGIRGTIQKVVLRLADGAITRYALQSTGEIPLFSKAWGIPESKTRFVPYFFTFTKRDFAMPATASGNFIFAGGNSHRDYLPLLEAVDMLREHKFVIATRLLEGRWLPPNVQAGSVSHEEFVRLMYASDAVVVPIKKDLIRAAGQQTYLNAMMFGKPTIVNNVPGVSDHILDGETAIVVDGTPESYLAAIRKVFDPANANDIKRMCQRAKSVVRQRFTFERHAKQLLNILDEATQEALPNKK